MSEKDTSMFNYRESEIMEVDKALQQYPTLEEVTRSHLSTAQSAFYLLRQQQTLRVWACHENGPLRPIRVNGRLAWPVSEIKRVLGVTK